MKSNLPQHMSRMFKMFGQAISRKLPFSSIYDDRMACLALEMVCQFLQLLLVLCLALTYIAFNGYPISTTFCLFYWIFMMGHYLSVANAYSRMDNVLMLGDTILFIYGIIVFLLYVSGSSSGQNVCSVIYWILMPLRYVYTLIVDGITISRSEVTTGGITIKTE
ncbi:Hypothetical_protein [Hexamita inflata]|uniref:Hypothetical_protein n=1 Tax=Hexamita inflata TaxID=28002 RepID=A0AA86VPQ7_9EUKA|nr:Hypothetical protein HINF_LOCUS60273 [Hexamita inflata]